MRIGAILSCCLWLAGPEVLFAQLVTQTATQTVTYTGDAILESLSGVPADPAAGRKIVLSRQTGLCILCHSVPFPEERFQGSLAPDLIANAATLSTGQLRARIVDADRFNPGVIMPSYYRIDHLTHVAPQFAGKTILSAQEIEDVVAFLSSFKS